MKKNKKTDATQDVSSLLAQARQHQEAGRLSKAEKAYRAVLLAEPHLAEAHYRLGTIALAAGRNTDACPHFKAAVDAAPAQGDYWLMYVEALLRADRSVEAMAVLQSAMACGLRGMGADLLMQRIQQAQAGMVLPTPKQEISPDLARELESLLSREKYQELEKLAKQVCERTPSSSIAWRHFGMALLLQGKNALEALEKSQQLDPANAQTLIALGVALSKAGDKTNAEKQFREVVKLAPDAYEGYMNLGEILLTREQMTEAIACLRKSLSLNPNQPQCLINLGNALHNTGELAEAAECFFKAEKIWQRGLPGEYPAWLLLPVIAASRDEILHWRQRFAHGLTMLAGGTPFEGDPTTTLTMPSFYLAYHDEDNRELMESFSAVMRKRCRQLDYEAAHIQSWTPPTAENRKIRFGILSEFLRNHSVGKLVLGLIENLDRSRFELTLIHTAVSRRDAFSDRMDALAHNTVRLPAGLKAMQQAVAAEQLDVLFYPDLGMVTTTYCLAHARLAPVQVTSWGHPHTTGINTVDYYVSSDHVEGNAAEKHYSESLIRLSRLPTCFHSDGIRASGKSRAELGLPEGKTLYACPQSLFKLHPDFDTYLAKILQADPDGIIVLIAGIRTSWLDMLKRRWATTYPQLNARSVILDYLSQEDFGALIREVDVLLDPIHFGSGLTMYDGLLEGLPIVTQPGAHARSRIVAGAYRQAGLEDAAPIAGSRTEYVDLAVSFATDSAKNRAWRKQTSQSARKHIFDDHAAVREFETFTWEALEAATHGKRLASGWCVHPIK